MFLEDKFKQIAPDDKNTKLDCSSEGLINLVSELIQACFQSYIC